MFIFGFYVATRRLLIMAALLLLAVLSVVVFFAGGLGLGDSERMVPSPSSSAEPSTTATPSTSTTPSDQQPSDPEASTPARPVSADDPDVSDFPLLDSAVLQTTRPLNLPADVGYVNATHPEPYDFLANAYTTELERAGWSVEADPAPPENSLVFTVTNQRWSGKMFVRKMPPGYQEQSVLIVELTPKDRASS